MTAGRSSGRWIPYLFSDGRLPNLGTADKGAVAEGECWDLRRIGVDLVIANWKLQFGADMDPGSGEYLLVLPEPCATPPAFPVGSGYVYQTVPGRTEGNVRLIECVAATERAITFFLSGEGDYHHVRHDNPWEMKPGYYLQGICMYRPKEAG